MNKTDDKQHSAWLIECVTAPTPLWFTGSFERDGRKRIAQFVADANGAVRYPSRAAAEWAFESLQEMRPRSILGNSCYRITEHEWFPSATLPSDISKVWDQAIEAAAAEVETHWNNTDTQVNQHQQALRSARMIRKLKP